MTLRDTWGTPVLSPGHPWSKGHTCDKVGGDISRFYCRDLSPWGHSWDTRGGAVTCPLCPLCPSRDVPAPSVPCPPPRGPLPTSGPPPRFGGGPPGLVGADVAQEGGGGPGQHLLPHQRLQHRGHPHTAVLGGKTGWGERPLNPQTPAGPPPPKKTQTLTESWLHSRSAMSIRGTAQAVPFT